MRWHSIQVSKSKNFSISTQGNYIWSMSHSVLNTQWIIKTYATNSSFYSVIQYCFLVYNFDERLIFQSRIALASFFCRKALAKATNPIWCGVDHFAPVSANLETDAIKRRPLNRISTVYSSWHLCRPSWTPTRRAYRAFCVNLNQKLINIHGVSNIKD